MGGPNRIERSNAPTAECRAILTGRLAMIDAGLERADRADAAEAVLTMFDAWPGVKMDGNKVKGVAVTYTDVLRDLPLWAIRQGVADCQRKAAAFPPSAGELRAAALARVGVFQAEAKSIERVLKAEIFIANPKRADEVKARVRQAARKLGAPFRPTHLKPDFREESSDAERRLAAMPYASTPCALSDEARNLS